MRRALLPLLLLMAACSHDTVGSLGQEVTLLVPEEPNGGLVVYAHGAGAHHDAITVDSTQKAVADELVRRGWLVGSSEMHGSNWGNEASVEDIATLIGQVREDHDVERVVLWGASMGGLPTLIAAGELDDVDAWVGSAAVCDPETLRAIAGDQLDEAGARNPLDVLDPSALADVPLRFYASPEDQLVVKETNTDVCAERFGGEVVEVTGDHPDPSNYPPAGIADFADAAL